MCKITGCPYHHDKHVCVICSDPDANHFGSMCSKGMEIYHGTSTEHADVIQKQYFKVTPNGCLGKGVYFATNFYDALNIALYKYKLNWAVIKVRALVEPDQDIQQDPKKLLKFYNEVAMTRYHQPWANLPSFREVVIRIPSKIRIIKIYKRKKDLVWYDDRILSEYNWQNSVKTYLQSNNKSSKWVAASNEKVEDCHERLLQLRSKQEFKQQNLKQFSLELHKFLKLVQQFAEAVQKTGEISQG